MFVPLIWSEVQLSHYLVNSMTSCSTCLEICIAVITDRDQCSQGEEQEFLG